MDHLLNDVQLGMLYHTKKKNSIHGIYNTQVVIEWKENVDCIKLQETWDYLIRTYEVLRAHLKNDTTMTSVDNLRVRVNRVQQTNASATDVDKTIKKLLNQSFDLYTAPLYHLTVLQVNDNLSYLIWTHHHIILAASSITAIISSMFQHYDGELSSKQNKKIVSYGHYSSAFCEQDQVYWDKVLSGFSESNQMKIAHAQELQGRPQHNNHRVNAGLSIESFTEQAKNLGVTANTLFLAAWAIILNRYTLDDDIVFGTVRRQVDNHRVGMDINTLPLRVIFTDNLSLFELCSSIRMQQIELATHSNLSLREISKNCFHKKNQKDELFSTFVDFLTLSMQDLLEANVSNMKNRHFHVNSRSHYPLNLAVYFEHGILNLRFDYNESLFSSDIISQIAHNYLQVLQALLRKEDSLCSSINVLNDDEKSHCLPTTNHSDSDVMIHEFIHELIQVHTTKAPHHAAIIEGDTRMTYQQLDEQSTQIARHLIQSTQPNDVVAIQTHSRVNQIVLMLSVLRAGCVYLNINPIYPETTKKLLLEKSNAAVLLVDEVGDVEYHAPNRTIFSINELKNKKINQQIPSFRETKERLAYIIFTSGSTGEPKPVLIKQQSVINLVCDTNYIQINNTDVMAQIANPSFDAATFEIWGALLNGATLAVIPKNILLDFDSLGFYLVQHKVSILLCITSLFNQIAQQKPEVFQTLRCLLVGGETLYAKYVQLVLDACKNSELTIGNAYGPTENTVISTFHTIHQNDELNSGTISIGKPIANTKIFVLDSKKRRVPAGVIGELHVAGEGLAVAYYKNQSATEEKFINAYGERVYCTGDYVYLDHDNNLHYVGRRDTQVKVNGYRIELSEIKKHLLSHEGIKEVELVIDEIDNRKNIVAFVAFTDSQISSQELKHYLKYFLPDHMIPSTFVGLASLPITINHKVDLTKLKEIQQQSRESSLNQQLEIAVSEGMILAWEKTFKRKINSQANFFDLGGDSIDALQLIYHAAEQGFHFRVDDLFQLPDIQDLQQFCTAKTVKKSNKCNNPEKKVSGLFFPTPIQSWFMSFGEQHVSQFAQVCHITLQSTVSLDDVKIALNQLIQHHDLLRLRFIRSIDGKTSHPYIMPFSERDDSFIRYVDGHELHRTDVFNGPIISVHFEAFADDNKHSLSVAINHLAVDGVSWRIMVDDLNALLTHQLDETCLPEKTNSYIEWSEHLFLLAQEDKTLSLASQWETTKDSLAELKPRETFASATCYENTIDKTLIVDLEQAAKSQAFQFSDILLLSFLMALEAIGESTEIALETHGRNISLERDISRTVGWFTCLFPFHFKYGISKIHIEDIYKLSKAIIEAKDKGHAYGLLHYMSQRKPIEGQNNLIDLPSKYFNYLGNLDSHDSELCSIESIDALIDEQFPLYFSLSADLLLKRHRLFFKVTYNKETYSQERIEHLFTCFKQNLADFNQFFKQRNIYPLSPVQSGIYAFCNIHPESESYFVQAVCDLKGMIHVNQLKRACEQLIQSNDVYRARFHSAHGVILQSVDAEARTVFQVKDWSSEDNEHHNERVINFLNSDRQTVFRLAKSPLIRFTLIQLSRNHYKFIASFHHIIMDGWSFYLALQQLLNYYNGLNTAFESNRFYSEYIKSLAHISKAAESKEFWINYLDKESLATRLNFHKQYEKGITYKELPHSKETVTLSSELTNRLRAFSSQYQVTLNAVIQSAFAISLSEYSNQNKVTYAIACSGRGANHKLHQVIGPVISTLPCSVSINTSISMLQLIQQVQTNIITLQQHEHASSLVIAKHLDVEPKNLFEYLFVYENYPTSELSCGDFRVGEVDIIERTQYPLTFYVLDDQEMRIQVQYDSQSFASSDVQLFVQSLVHQIELITSQPHELISTFYMRAIMDKDQGMNKQLIRQDECTDEVIDVSLLLQESFQKNKSLAAIIFEDCTISYDDLLLRVQSLQHHLINRYPTQTVIGILLERTPDYVVAIIAALHANCIFVPLDVSFPDARLAVMIEQAGIQAIISDSSSTRPDLPVDTMILDMINWSELEASEISRAINYSSHDLAYILFTSGSTGNPKGVTISRGAISTILKSVTEMLALPESLVVMGVSSFIFDISLIDVLLPLTRRGTLLLTNTQEQMNASQQKKYATYYHVNFMQATPTMWSILLDSHWQPPKEFILISTGEALPGDLRDTLISYDCQVWNLYGPTETTIWATGLSLSKAMSTYQPASCIGLPLSGVDCYVMDAQCHPVKPGVVGELYIGGRGLSNGYVNAPELTQRQFINHPDIPGMVLYKTADYVRFTPDFGLEYKGRVDTQVKIHGRRIELEEIEAILMKEEQVSFAVTVVAGELLAKKIVAFICLTDKQLKKTFDVEKLKQSIKAKLPNFMIPSHVEILDEMPLTSTKKVDRKVLHSLASSLRLKDRVIIEPENDTQMQLRQLWSETLMVSENNISIDDDYFLLGGNSISAITLSVAIEQRFSIYYPIHYVIENPTLSEQAEKIIEQGVKYKTKSVYEKHDILNNLDLPLVPIKAAYHKQNIFLIHPIGGTIFRYMALARYLGEHYNVYGIQDPGIEAQSYLFDSLESLSAHYLKVIQAFQPYGPYIIGGASYGGNVSIEIARQLFDKGVKEVQILSFDAWALYPAMANNNRDWFENNIKRQAADLRQMLPSEIALPELLLDLTWQRQQLIVEYKVQKRTYNLALFKSNTLTPVLEPIQEEFNHWRDFCEIPIDKYNVPGDHESMLNEPNVYVLYKAIMDYLSKPSFYDDEEGQNDAEEKKDKASLH